MFEIWKSSKNSKKSLSKLVQLKPYQVFQKKKKNDTDWSDNHSAMNMKSRWKNKQGIEFLILKYATK